MPRPALPPGTCFSHINITLQEWMAHTAGTLGFQTPKLMNVRAARVTNT